MDLETGVYITNNKMNWKRFLELSITKTVYFNLHYFGWKALIYPRVIISKNVRFEQLEGNVVTKSDSFASVRLGFKSVPLFDFKYQRFAWSNTGIIIFGNNVNIGQGCAISNSGRLEFEDSFNISACTNIVCRKHIRFGMCSLVSWKCLIMDTDWHKIYDDSGIQQNDDEDCVVGKNVWIGANCTLLKGSNVPDGSVVGAGSTLSGVLNSDNSIYINSKTIKRNITWKY